MSDSEIYKNYSDAQKYLSSPDLSVVRTLIYIHSSMLDNVGSGIVPRHPFDMRYFYSSVLKVIADTIGHQIRDINFPRISILAHNVPDIKSEDWHRYYLVSSGIVDEYIHMIQGDSQQDGNPFDVGFACTIMVKAIDEEALKNIQEAVGQIYEQPPDTFENWLQGKF